MTADELAALHAELARMVRDTQIAVFRRVLSELEQASLCPTQPKPRRAACQPERKGSGSSDPTTTTDNGALSFEERMNLRSRARAILAGKKR